jgi:anaerobic ribonucleoside-triphosphate reductase
MFGGQSINCWDGSLAPYVDKSFKKAFRNNLLNLLNFVSKDVVGIELLSREIKSEHSNIPNCLPSYLNLDDKKRSDLFGYIKECVKETSRDDIFKCIDTAYKNACTEVEDETMQAMEGAIHNFNTLHCLPATERIWIYDEKEKELKLMSMEELDNSFEKNRFKVISVNKTTGKAEFKYILSSEKLQNNRRLVEVKTKTGQKVRVTDNHRMMYIKDNGEITEAIPESEEYQNSLSPRKIVFPEFSPKKYKILDYSKRGCVYKNNKLSIETIEMNEDLAEILGYYIADGSTKKKDDSYITFTTCEKVDGEYLKSLIRGYFGENVKHKEITYVREKDGMTVTKSHIFYLGTAVSRIFKEMCGENALNKKVPNDIMMAPNSVARRFLNAYLSCDGRRGSYNEFSTVSKTLRNQINLLIMRLGELPSYSEGMSSGNLISTNTLYTGRLGNFASKRAGIEVFGSDTSFEILRYNSAPITKRLKELKIPWGDAEEGKIPYRQSKEIRIHEVQNIVEKNKLKGFDTVINTYSIPIVSKEESNSGEEYVYDISVEDNESFLTEEGIYVHNSRAGAQVPFSSINYGIDTSPEGRLITKKTLDAIWNGLGHGETPIFPISVFQLRSGVNFNPGDPNYDLFQYACKVSAKRLFPNFMSLDSSFNAPYYKAGDHNSYVATMG